MNHFTNEHTLIKSKKKTPSLEQSRIKKIALIEIVTRTVPSQMRLSSVGSRSCSVGLTLLPVTGR